MPALRDLPFARYVDKARHGLGPVDVLQGCDALVVTGVQTHLCVLASALEAAGRDLVPVVVADATAARTADLHDAALAVLSAGHAHVASAAEVHAAFLG